MFMPHRIKLITGTHTRTQIPPKPVEARPRSHVARLTNYQQPSRYNNQTLLCVNNRRIRRLSGAGANWMLSGCKWNTLPPPTGR